MRTEFELIFETYSQAKAEGFQNHPAAEFVRQDLSATLREATSDSAPDFFVRSSAGQSRWADTPWAAVLDPLVTRTPQEGIYIVYIFSASMERLYLSLNQGMERYRKRAGGRSAKILLQATAARMRKVCPEHVGDFPVDRIDLGKKTAGDRASFYELGHAFGKEYTLSLPDEAELRADLEAMIRLYRSVTFEGLAEEQSPLSLSSSETVLEFNNRMRLHLRVERNPRLSKMVKRLQGTTCKACGFNFGEVYGSLGAGYIEAHHITPLAQLPKDRAVPLNPRKDFTVLCANCHRMIHLHKTPLTLAELEHVLRTERS